MRLSLLDTDILSEFLKQKNPTVLKEAAEYLAELLGHLRANPSPNAVPRSLRTLH